MCLFNLNSQHANEEASWFQPSLSLVETYLECDLGGMWIAHQSTTSPSLYMALSA